MRKLENIIDYEGHVFTRADCIRAAKGMGIMEPDQSDKDGITGEAVIMLQLFTQMVYNIQSGHNAYSGSLRDGYCLYPQSYIERVIDVSTGKFWVDNTAGLLHAILPNNKTYFLIGDPQRTPINYFLASAHFFAHRLHNKLITTKFVSGYEDAKKITLACMARVFLDIFKIHFGFNSDSEMIKVGKTTIEKLGLENDDNFYVINSREAVYGFMRWAHYMTPSSINGISLTHRNRMSVKTFNWEQTFIGERRYIMPKKPQAGLMMCNDDNDVRVADMTMSTRNDIASWKEVCEKIEASLKPKEDMPLMLGIIKDCSSGMPGSVTRALVSACVYEALWHDDLLNVHLPDGIYTGKKIIEFVEGK